MNLLTVGMGEVRGDGAVHFGVFFFREPVAESLMLHQIFREGQEMEELSMLPQASSVKVFERW